jgi:antitoxin (DNA-binding transcriptional repressor) of toxin-antitoxin stability system
MKVTATELANDSKAIIDRVIEQREPMEVQRHGKTVAVIRPKVGVDREEFLRIMTGIKWTKAEAAELKRAMDMSSVFGYAGRD